MKTAVLISLVTLWGFGAATTPGYNSPMMPAAQTTREAEKQISLDYDPATGELSVNAHGELTAIDIGRPPVIISQIPLQRTTYRVPQSKSKALANFLNSHVDVKPFSVECSEMPLPVEPSPQGDLNEGLRAITITAGPETQKVMEGFIRLLHHQPAGP